MGRAVLVALLICGAQAAPAQVSPRGPEFQVNTVTGSTQTGAKSTPAPDGSFVVVWYSEEGPWGIHGQRFSATGSPLGPELTMDQQTPPIVPPLDLATGADGEFVVVWGRGLPGCPSCWSDYIKGRRFDAEGFPLGDQFAISESDEYVRGSAVAAHSDGSFVVVWEHDYDPFARRFASDGAPAGLPFPLPLNVSVAGFSPDATLLSDGSSFLSWMERDGSGNHTVVAQRYDSGGSPVGGLRTLVGPSDDGFDYEWSSSTSDELVVVSTGPSGTVVGRRFDAKGDPLGSDFVVNTYIGLGSSEPSVHHSKSGEFVVAWESKGSPGDDSNGWSLQARRFASDGTPLGNQFQVNAYTTGNQAGPHATTLANGELLITWSSAGSFGSDTSFSSVQARIFRVPLFMDGFENGTTSRWSLASNLWP